ncbi:hypothetical protein ACA910_003902 [Epithemia clementina (nom. ined.)]
MGKGRQRHRRVRPRFIHKCLVYFALCTLLASFYGVWKAVTFLEQRFRLEHYPIYRFRKHLQHEQEYLQIDSGGGLFNNTSRHSHGSSNIPPPDNGHRYIVFTGVSAGQGAGNIMQGLLAAQLLGVEFNRTVCVVWPKFFEAFEYAQPDRQLKLCQDASRWKRSYSFVIWNFISGRVDECKMRGILANRENTVVGYTGNTYPGWRSEIPSNFFHQYYRPKSDLIQFLPYHLDYNNIMNNNNAPKVVVHLRSPDGNSDQDRGLDEESLKALGRLLPGNGTYLVTNRPDFYRRFHECCGWSYDTSWIDKPIHHGGIGLAWNPDGSVVRKKNKNTEKDQNLKLWSDWYIMLNAEKVYHSPSDFSRSAIHWNAAHVVGYELHGMKKSSKSFSKNSERERELNLHLSYDPSSSKRIPPLVERLEPDSLRDDDGCIFLRFCQNLTSSSSINKNPGSKVTRQIDELMVKLGKSQSKEQTVLK